MSTTSPGAARMPREGSGLSFRARMRARWLKTKETTKYAAAVASKRVKQAGIKSARFVKKSASWIYMKSVNGLKIAGLAIVVAAKGTAYLLMRGLGYLVYGITRVAERIVRLALLIVVMLLVVLVAAILLVLISIQTFLNLWNRVVCGHALWVAHGAGTHRKSYTTRRPWEEDFEGRHTTQEMRFRTVGAVERMLHRLLDDRIVIDDPVFGEEHHQAMADAEKYADEPWVHLNDPRMNDYSGLDSDEVDKRHRLHLNWLLKNGQYPLDCAYWAGRQYMLQTYMADSTACDRVEQVYQDWRKTQPRRGSVNKQEFRKGLRWEAEVIRFFWVNRGFPTGEKWNADLEAEMKARADIVERERQQMVDSQTA